jgi:fido (protein-threonine AMPylation protein)
MAIDNDELDRFFESPDFSISAISCDCNEAFGLQKEWDHYMDVDLLSQVTLISSKTSSMKYGFAKKRYLGLTRIRNTKTVTFPFFFLALAEAHFLLSDLHGCQDVLKELTAFVPQYADLIHLIEIVSKLLERDTICDDEYHNQPETAHVHTFSTPFACPTSADCASLQTLQLAWEGMKENEEDALLQFQRYACVSTNILEDVFCLEGQSWPCLIRRGFYVNSIDGISLLSKQKKKKVIIRILQNTQQSLVLLSQCLDDYSMFTEAFIKKIHSTILQDDNFVEEQCEDHEGDMYSVFMLIPSGRYRQVACVAGHQDGTEVTQFCRHSDISAEMNRYCELARAMLINDAIDVFMKVAWLQWALLRIHPFADGNGRVARIISSLPLCKLHLPPVAVSQANKMSYFNSLHTADRMNNLRPLANFLQESIEGAIMEIDQLPSVLELSTTCGDGKTRTRKVDELLSSSSDEESRVHHY